MIYFHGISQSWRVARDVNESLKEAYKIDCDMLTVYSKGYFEEYNSQVQY